MMFMRAANIRSGNMMFMRGANICPGNMFTLCVEQYFGEKKILIEIYIRPLINKRYDNVNRMFQLPILAKCFVTKVIGTEQ